MTEAEEYLKWKQKSNACTYFKVTAGAISSCVNGLTKTSCGFIWKYKK